MKYCIIALTFLLAVNKSLAVFPIHYPSIGLESTSPPQFFYPYLERNLPQQQFPFHPEHRTFPDIYQSSNYACALNYPVDFYNRPVPARYPYYLDYIASNNPAVRFIQQQRQQPVLHYPKDTEIIPRPMAKDFKEIIKDQPNPEKITKTAEENAESISEQTTLDSMNPETMKSADMLKSQDVSIESMRIEKSDVNSTEETTGKSMTID